MKLYKKILTIVIIGFSFILPTITNAAITSPADITGGNLKLWLDANDIDGDGNGGNNPSNGSSVATWTDKSGNTKNATNGDAAHRPTYTTNALNSKPVVSFNGSVGQVLSAGVANDWKFLSDTLNGSSVFIVVKSTMADNGHDFILNTGWPGSGGSGFLMWVSSNTQSFTDYMGQAPAVSLISKSAATAPGQLTDYKVHSIITKTTSNVFQHFDGGGLLSQQKNFMEFPNTANVPFSNLIIGANAMSYDYPLSGGIAEIAMYDRNLSASERKDVECYLQTKWGLATSSCPDLIAPTLSNISSTTTNGTYGVGQAIDIRATFSEPVDIGSTMTVVLNTGKTVVLDTPFENTLYGTYIPNVGESTSDLSISSITSASVADLSGNTVTSFSVPSAPNNIADQKAIVVVTNTTQVPVIIIAGQSNALGRADLAAISRIDATNNTKIIDQNLASFAVLQQGTNQHYTNPTTQFGPEMGIAYAHKDEGGTPDLYIVKIAYGNTFLKPFSGYSDWSPDSNLSLFSNMITKSRSAFTQINAAGFTPNVLGMYWMQGENDAIFTAYANEYQANLTYLISQARSQLGFDSLPIAIGNIRNSGSDAAIIRAAQLAVINAGTNTCLINTDDVTMNVDNVHYSASGQMIIGERVWNAFKDCDHTSPVLSTKTIDGDAVVLTFDEPINADSVPSSSTFTIKVNGTTRSVSSVAVSGSTITFTTATPVLSTDSVTLEYAVPVSNKIADWSLNTLGAISTPVALTNLTVDSVAPTISSVTSTDISGTYTIGQSINITVNFSEAVTSTGSVTVSLNNGGSCTFTVSGGSTGSCIYTVAQGQSTATLSVSSVSGTIADAALNPMVSFTVGTNLSPTKTIVIDAPVPVATGGVPLLLPALVKQSEMLKSGDIKTTSASCAVFTTPASLNKKNSRVFVTKIQTLLKGYNKSQLVTGFYGPMTKRNIFQFQKENGLIPTGITGKVTLDKLNTLYCK